MTTDHYAYCVYARKHERYANPCTHWPKRACAVQCASCRHWFGIDRQTLPQQSRCR